MVDDDEDSVSAQIIQAAEAAATQAGRYPASTLVLQEIIGDDGDQSLTAAASSGMTVTTQIGILAHALMSQLAGILIPAEEE